MAYMASPIKNYHIAIMLVKPYIDLVSSHTIYFLLEKRVPGDNRYRRQFFFYE